jgi:hypothetical protein
MEVEIERENLLDLLQSLETSPGGAHWSELPGRIEACPEVLAAAFALGLVKGEPDALEITTAGQQYLDGGGELEPASLAFLAQQVDDLVARAALREAARRVIDDLSQDLIEGRKPRQFRRIAPHVLPNEIDQALAVRLFAAANSLVARLAEGGRPQCIAEDIVGALITETARRLVRSGWVGDLSEDERQDALLAVSMSIIGLGKGSDLLGETSASVNRSSREPFAAFFPSARLGYLDARLQA